MGLIVDEHGKPLATPGTPALRAQTDGVFNARPGTPLGLAPYSFPYEASAWLTQEMGNWLPWIRVKRTKVDTNFYKSWCFFSSVTNSGLKSLV
ncbi:hypothetical protein [Paraburkholderia sp. MM5384-R2]|uniref:hypothetical protein n=1 Tax=Paraburkholderia sp. MM5384-R2 TaxID=2723097 RepID=UPI001619A203|nr:hypothetical protein [Paraburkholderia sp. MM5384-R2]MBB5502045.1 hypothetical protein [Paraburkholderia sp. MM5384-R2]